MVVLALVFVACASQAEQAPTAQKQVVLPDWKIERIENGSQRYSAYDRNVTDSEPGAAQASDPEPAVSIATEVPAVQPESIDDGVPDQDSGYVVFLDGELERLICSYAWDCSEAVRVAHCESGPANDFTLPLDGAWAENGISYGLFALYGGHVAKWPEMFDLAGDGVPWWAHAEWSTSHAYEMWTDQGWRPWMSSSYCSGVY